MTPLRLGRLASFVPLALARRVCPRPLLSVFYHTVAPEPLPHIAPLYAHKTAEAFERDLLFLKEHFTPVGHAEVAAACEGRAPLPQNAAQVSFDDGLAECFTLVRPLLLQHRVPCTFFLVKNLLDNRSLMYRNAAACCIERLDRMDEPAAAGACESVCSKVGAPVPDRAALRAWIDGLKWTHQRELDAACEAVGFEPHAFLRERRPYMTTEQALTLARDGFTLGGHTCDHPNLADLPWDAAAAQIADSCRFVAELVGAPKVPIAIPFNGVMLSRERLDAVRAGCGAIDLVYDTNNLRRERPWVVNRVWCDSPEGDGPRSGRSNLADAVRAAHLLEPARALARRLKKRPR